MVDNSPLAEADRLTTGAVLRSALIDLIDLSLIGKQAHWNVVGKHFRSVHLQLDELVGIAGCGSTRPTRPIWLPRIC